ncbi:hypothetical protein TNCV_2568001 [Trichonephila clavipes]|uniref:Uncharacterized protein n=1 Tax=Trichonephila clavipes TaxID=2585209 RepID=A0A8X6WKI8_TRICX|nr:hypothetical protein TNCV_2568001 [Trichonephila clavipes]
MFEVSTVYIEAGLSTADTLITLIQPASCAVGKSFMIYDGEVLAVCEATTQLISAGLAPAEVFFIDSQAPISVLSSNTLTDGLNTI